MLLLKVDHLLSEAREHLLILLSDYLEHFVCLQFGTLQLRRLILINVLQQRVHFGPLLFLIILRKLLKVALQILQCHAESDLAILG